MDLTSAVNIMLWAENCLDRTPSYAIWHIFPAHVSGILRAFLVKYAGFRGNGDPVHSQILCLMPALLDLLYTEYSVKPYTICQYPKQAVYIPAGCAHQVGDIVHTLCG